MGHLDIDDSEETVRRGRRFHSYTATPPDEAFLSYIADFWQEHNYSPSVRDIKAALKLSSVSVVAYRLHNLREDGKLFFDDNITRSYRLPSMRITFSADSAGDPKPKVAAKESDEETIIEVVRNLIQEFYQLYHPGIVMNRGTMLALNSKIVSLIVAREQKLRQKIRGY